MNESEQKWIDQLKHEHDLYKKHLKVYEDEILEYKEAARSEADTVNELQAKNKKLREALEFYAEPWERGEYNGELLVRKLGSYDNFKEVHSVAREALKEVEDTK